MENIRYTIRLEPKSPGTINLDQVKGKLLQRGFKETDVLSSHESHFVLNKPAYVLHAHLEMGRNETDSNNESVLRVSLSLDIRRLLVDAISSAAAELSGTACSLAHNDNMPPMLLHDEDTFDGQPQDCPDCDNPCDWCNRLEKSILQRKRLLQKFQSVSAEDALRWMEDFPQRKEKFVAAVREGKDRDISA